MNSSVKIVGHRGAMGLAPENTLASFEKAWRLGVDAVECDVHFTKERDVLVIHDENLSRLSSHQGFIRHLNKKELKKIDIDKKSFSRFAGESLLFFSELLDWIKFKKNPQGNPLELFVELKDEHIYEKELERRVVEILKQKKMIHRTTAISFHHGMLRRIRQICPSLRTGLVFCDPIMDWEERILWAQPDMFFAHRDVFSPSFVRRVKKKGLYVGAYNVNTLADLRKSIKNNVDIFSTDFPNRIHRSLLPR